MYFNNCVGDNIISLLDADNARLKLNLSDTSHWCRLQWYDTVSWPTVLHSAANSDDGCIAAN